MKKYLVLLIFALGISLQSISYANWFADIIDSIEKTNAIDTDILHSQNVLLDVQRDMLFSQKDIEGLMKQVSASVIGNSGWGTYNYHDYESYGNDAYDWASVMRMVSSGRGVGALGQTVNTLAGEFPIDKQSFNKGTSNASAQKYYAVQSQTILATRAASQLDYDKIQDQIAYQQMLQQQIEKTKDLKAAVDLNNRIQVENNLISLELLRQSALSNQQHAIVEQATMNGALSNAKFLTKNPE